MNRNEMNRKRSRCVQSTQIFTCLLFILLLCGIANSQQEAAPVPAGDQERAIRLSALPLNSDNFKFSFRVTDTGGAMVVTAMRETEADGEEHLQRRLGQLARLAVRCVFTAPEFRQAGSSQQTRSLCDSKPKIHTLVGHDSRSPQYGTIVLEFKADRPDSIHLLQDLVRTTANKYPDSELDDAPGK